MAKAKRVSDHLFIRILPEEEENINMALLESQERALISLEIIEDMKDDLKEKKSVIFDARETLKDVKKRFVILKECIPIPEEEKEEGKKGEKKEVKEKREEKGKSVEKKEEAEEKKEKSRKEKLRQELEEIRERLKSLSSKV